MGFKNLDEVAKAVDAAGGVRTVFMGDLRDAYGNEKLGKWVRQGISKQLHARGIGHYPEELPEYQELSARLYRLGSPAGDLIHAVVTMGADADDDIRSAVSGDAMAKLTRIREIVCS